MNRVKKYKYHILSFMVPLIICIIILYIKGLLKNPEAFIVSDLRDQHFAFYTYFKNVLLGKASIHYSYYAGFGNSMISTFIYYLMSPLNIFILLFNKIKYFLLFIFVVKICLSGLTMFIFLDDKYKRKSYITIVFSTCYALSSFVFNYSFCIFWFDAIYLAPLVLLGINRMIREEKINYIYIIALTLSIISNLQMGFGLCIFSLIYYLYSFNIKYDYKKNRKKLIRVSKIFIISSLCVGAISSGFIICIVQDFERFSLARKLIIVNIYGTSSIDHIINGLFSVGKKAPNYVNLYKPYLYCGFIISFLSILYVFSDSISKKKRKHALIVILIFFISFCFAFLNDFWHLSRPILVNYRYSIYLSLFLVMIAYEFYITNEILVKRDIIILIVLLLVGLFIDNIYKDTIYFKETIIFLAISILLLILVKNISKKFEIIMFIVVAIELVFNAKLSFYTNEDWDFLRYSSYDSLMKVAKFNKFDQGYRLITDYTYTERFNDVFLFNRYSSMRYFSSIVDGSLIRFFDRNEVLVSKNSYIVSAYDNPLLLSLLGNKYSYLTEDYGSELYNKVDEYKIKSYDYADKKNKTKKVYLYENPYALSLGYVVDKDAKYKKKYDLVDYQNSIIKSFTGNDKNVLIRLKYGTRKYDSYCDNTENCERYYVENDTNNKLVYFYTRPIFIRRQLDLNLYGDYANPLLFYHDEKIYDFYLFPDEGYDKSRINAVTYDKDVLIDSLKQLQNNMLTDVKINNNVLKGKIDTDKNGILFLSIPYDKRFKIYVDGKKVKYYSMLDKTFIGFDIEKGKHNIKVVNVDDNFKIYMLISLISLFVMIKIKRFVNKKK
ncbi:MAG: YfhO family protein [Bacilli bacterium]|nr:YfhO family protein [Bacilli bacterium]